MAAKIKKPRSSLVVIALFFLLLLPTSCLSSLYKPPLPSIAYHHGDLLDGPVPVSVLFYGSFSPSQASIITDFISSLTPRSRRHGELSSPRSLQSVSKWWATVNRYVVSAGRERTRVLLANLVYDGGYSLGKLLSRRSVQRLARSLGVTQGGVAVVITSSDVAVEGFCITDCGLHGALPRRDGAYIWVGDAATQCPGRCAWPFHSPDDFVGPAGRRATVLTPPNGDAGVDGMVINIATLLAGAVTNPYGNGYYQGEPGAGVELGAMCSGVYGVGAFPGYPGTVRIDPATGGAYNVDGVNGRKFLVPALVDPVNLSCIITG